MAITSGLHPEDKGSIPLGTTKVFRKRGANGNTRGLGPRDAVRIRRFRPLILAP